MSFLGFLLSSLTGLSLACFYMLNKRLSTYGDTYARLLCIFSLHMPVFFLYLGISGRLDVSGTYFIFGSIVTALSLAGNLLTIRALALSPFSLVIPVLGLSPVFASLISIPLLNEWPSLRQWAGIGVTVVGIFLLYMPPDRPFAFLSFWSRFIKERGAVPITLAALMWALCAPMDKLSLRHANVEFHATYVFGMLNVALSVIVWRNKSPFSFHSEHPKGNLWPILVLAGIIGAASYICQLNALQHAPAGAFEAIKRVMNQLLALGFGYFLFREEITRPKMIGIGVLTIGIPLIVI